MDMSAYQFTNDWFGTYARHIWSSLLPQLKPVRALEIGSYEGAAACFLVTQPPTHTVSELHCIDTWAGGLEHQAHDMAAVEQRFAHNMRTALAERAVELHVHKSSSDLCLARLLAEKGRGYFDFIYVDGSHQACDVLCDAVLAFRLLRVGGILAFDDYLWAEQLPGGPNPLRCPKPAIDSFTQLYMHKLAVIQTPMYQLYAQKLSD